MESMLNKIIEDYTKSLLIEKQILLKEVCIKLDSDFDFDKESQKMFPRLACKFFNDNMDEVWYWRHADEIVRPIIQFHTHCGLRGEHQRSEIALDLSIKYKLL